MAANYPVLSSEYEIHEKLHEMGIDLFKPQTRFEDTMAQALDDFSRFVLFEGREKCLKILESDLCNGGGSVGELQGGDDSFSIYRVSFPEDGADEYSFHDRKCKNATVKLLQEFHDHIQQTKRHFKVTLTIEKIRQYMLGMCDRRSKERCCVKYTTLGNLMFILCFGGSAGQVRHIDNMVSNLQICLYMSSQCPSTIVYAMDDEDGLQVTDTTTLLALWNRQNKIVPALIVDILQNHANKCLRSKWYTRYFGFWKTINFNLECFGKLYQPVSCQLSLKTDPGTTLLAGGNEVHAGPPTSSPRMFAFAVGIPDPDGDKNLVKGTNERIADEQLESDDNDGEVQYSPVLLHIDFCCLLFSILDCEYGSSEKSQSVVDAKYFLVNMLIELIRDYPMKGYLQQIKEDRLGIREWIEIVLHLIEQGGSVASSIDDAISSDEIFYSPDVVKQKLRKKKKGHRRVNRS
ncbi:hypothetical protein HJC23_007212 [Cyclotella cryptica]|uniref:Uncharacterized protein n=1 Tax=Cyclotella cryptica TaxID=29204 RepID=A0ABD3QQP5_9STRA|eukprot:CCRYP_003504-RA/>CCRYP_003504-RA protein AED:0.10 eAED:0.08 QI:0/-1/0/1/-1/1/1/0/460